MNLPSLLLLAVSLSGPALHAAKAKAPTEPATATAEPAPDTDLAKLSAAKRKVHELPEIASAQQQAKADRASASKAASDYKLARTKSAESETAYRAAYEAALTKADPAAAEILKKQRVAFRERMLKARNEKQGPASKKVSAADDEAADGADEKVEG